MTYEERINALTYYAPGDEGEELFRLTCSLAYTAYGLNQGDDRVEFLVAWAEEQAAESKEWAEEEGRDDFIRVRWGRA